MAGADKVEAGATMEATVGLEVREADSGAAMEAMEDTAVVTWAAREAGALEEAAEAGARAAASSGEVRARGAAPGPQEAEVEVAEAAVVR